MLTKESKIRVLENFYALDHIFFGKPVSEVNVCCPIMVEEYVSVKGALLSTMIEMYKYIGHNPNMVSEDIDSDYIMLSARQSAKIARENCEKLIETEQGREDIKTQLREIIETAEGDVDIENLVQEAVREKSYSLAVDNLLIARTLTESEDISKLNEWDGNLLETAYKMLRENLVESAIEILNNVED